jgi:hypothetical protein
MRPDSGVLGIGYGADPFDLKRERRRIAKPTVAKEEI